MNYATLALILLLALTACDVELGHHDHAHDEDCDHAAHDHDDHDHDDHESDYEDYHATSQEYLDR